MDWIICFCLAMGFLALAAVIATVFYFKKSKRGRIITSFHVVFGGVFVSTFTAFIPIYSSLVPDSASKGWNVFLFSLHNTLQCFTLDSDRASILGGIACPEVGLAAAYSIFLSLVYVIAPVLTFTFLISFFKNISAVFRYWIRFPFKKVYIFSELNERSLALASDLKKNHRFAVIVFTDVFEENDEVSYELVEQAKDLRAICFKKDILAVNFKAHSSAASIIFFVMGSDETENISQSMKLIDTYKDRANTRLFVFSSRVESELLLTKKDKGLMKVRRVNEVRSLVNRLLYEKGSDLFKNAAELPGGDKKISAVIVGLGGHGTEMLKSLSWFCQMDGYHVSIDAFERDPLAESRFTALAPELMSEKYNGKIIPGEAEYTIRIHSGIDVASEQFAEEIQKITDATYVFVSLGSDEMNIKTAIDLRKLFERMKIKPTIHAVVSGTDEKESLAGITNYRGQEYNISFIGDIKQSYSEAVILNSKLEEDALNRHKKWGKENEFWDYEYNYNSSVASAIHLKARIECGVAGADKAEEDLTKEERDSIEVIEHRRWNAYMRSEGYVYSGSPDKASRNDLAKMHHDLVDYSSLTDDEKRKDSKVGTK